MVRRAAYGAAELKALYQRHLQRAFSFSAAGHLLIALLFLAVVKFTEQPMQSKTIQLVSYADLGPPPSLTDQIAAPQIQVSSAAPPPTVGIPEPVPDAEVSPDATINTQVEMSAMTSIISSEGTGEGTVVQVEQPAPETKEIAVEEEVLPRSDEFVPVEEQPVPVERPIPEYPEMAIRAGIEGVVYVTILVDKTGKVRDAKVLKGPEVLREAALAAAWKSVWRPAIQNHRPVAVWVAYPFRFKLE
jgi:periplasmic protein TonB